MIPPIQSHSEINVKDSCNCCIWPWKKKDVYDPTKVRGHKKYSIEQKVHQLGINLKDNKK